MSHTHLCTGGNVVLGQERGVQRGLTESRVDRNVAAGAEWRAGIP